LSSSGDKENEMADKRFYQRYIRRLEVKYMKDEIEMTSITGNLSEEGMFIKLKRKIPVGTIVYLKLELPNFQEIKLIGEVVRNIFVVSGHLGHSKSGIGIHLINPSQEYIRFVRGHLN
jgi:Tfp pilus assembly protein PilZ